MNDKIGPKERQVRDLREQRDASKTRKGPSPSELRKKIEAVVAKPPKPPEKKKWRKS